MRSRQQASVGAKILGASVTVAGRAGDSSLVTRTVTIGMADAMRFTPGELVIEQGQTVKIIARNDGEVLHEIVPGGRAEIAQHRSGYESEMTGTIEVR